MAGGRMSTSSDPLAAGTRRTMKAMNVEEEAQTTTFWQQLAARPRLVQAFGVLVASLALVAAGVILDHQAAHKDYFEIVMMAVRNDGRALKSAGDLQDNKDVVLAAVQKLGDAVEWASPRLKNDRDVALKAVHHSDGRVLQRLPEELKNDEEVQLAAVRHHVGELRTAPLVKKNKAVVQDWARRQYIVLERADKDLKTDRDVVLEAVRQNGAALQYVHKADPASKLLKDREVVLEAVRTNGRALQWVSKASKNATNNGIDLTKDREVVLTAVSQYGLALEWASEDLRKDPEVVMAAVVNMGFALKFSLAEGKGKDQAEFAAIFADGRALQWASEIYTGDVKLVSEVVSTSKYHCPLDLKEGFEMLKRIGKEWQDSDREDVKYKMALAAVRSDGKFCLKRLGEFMPQLKSDRVVVDAAVRNNGMALAFADPVLQKDREVVLAAVRQDGLALEKSGLKDDKEVVLAAVQQNGLALQYAGRFDNDPKSFREVVLLAVRQNGKALKFADALKSDKEVVLAAVRHDRRLASNRGAETKNENMDWQHTRGLEFADEALRQDRDVVLAALRTNGAALEFAKVAEMTATSTRTTIAGVIALVLCIVVAARLVLTPQEASSDTAGPHEGV